MLYELFYILEINPLSVASLQRFSLILWVLFILLMVSFSVQKLSSLIRSHLFIFASIFLTLGVGLKKILLWFMSKNVLPVFSSKSFIASGLIFRSLIHFEFIFVYDVRECYNFILLHISFQFSQHNFWRDHLFSIVCSCLLCHRLIDHVYHLTPVRMAIIKKKSTNIKLWRGCTEKGTLLYCWHYWWECKLV